MNEQTYIYANRYKTGFPAILKMADGQPLETGQAMVSAETRSVDFVSDFVPLFTMGTPLEIVRTFHDQEIHSFCGAVYLSSSKLLRITSVKDTLTAGSEKFYVFPVDYAAQIQVPPSGEAQAMPTGRLRLRKRKAAPELEQFPVTVTGIALDAIEFTSPAQLPQGQQLLLSMAAPIELDEAPLEVRRILEFGASGQNYSCSILSLPRPVQRRWEDFIYELHIRNNKFF